MRTRFLVSVCLMAGLVGFTAACGEDAVTKICLSDDGNSQDCGLSCTISKSEEGCAKWKKLTEEICGKVTKEECQEICDKDKNPTACELVAKM